ncbi:MAG: cytochrome P450 [Gemmataceae bacterium]
MFEGAVEWVVHRARRALHAPLFKPEMLPDPYPTYHRLRSQDPVHWDKAESRWVLTRYADVSAVLRSPAASSDRAAAAAALAPPSVRPLLAFRANSMINSDAPKHTRLRLLVSKAFTARAVEAMTAKIQRLVDGLLDAVQPRGRMDAIADLAYPLPVTVIAEMLGVPAEDRDQFKHWSDELSLIVGNANDLAMAEYKRVGHAFQELVAYFARVVAERRVHPKDDLLSALTQAEEAGDRLSADELYATATLLLVAGNETTTNLIGNGTLALLRNPDQLARLTADPSLVPAAVEELLRYDSPVQFTGRHLKAAMTVGGKTLEAGQSVLLLLGAANRDPAQFADPDRLDVGRPDVKHLAFGLGSHFCLGAQLARLEGRIVFETLLRRMPKLRLGGPEPEYRPHFNLRGLKALPVTF